MMERRGLVVLGLILVAIGALLLGDTLGLLALDTRRLADYWPLVFVLIGLLVLLEAWSPGRRPDLREPAAGMPDATEADALERRLARLLALQPSAAAPPAAAAAADQPGAHQPAMDPEPRHADTVAALLELQGLRRNRLISKREYRAKRADLVARMSPYPAARYAEGGFAAGEGGSDLGGVPTSGAWPGRPPR